MGAVPEAYKPNRNGATVGLDIMIPVGESGWAVAGGAFGSVYSVRVPYALDGDYGKRMRWDAVVLHADAGRSFEILDRLHYRVRLGPGLSITGVGASQGGAETLDCQDDLCLPTGDYDIEDDRIVVQEAENEAPFLLGPVGYVSTGLQWSMGRKQPGLVLSLDAFGVLTTTHWRSGMNGSHMGVVLGLGIGGDPPKAPSNG